MKTFLKVVKENDREKYAKSLKFKNFTQMFNKVEEMKENFAIDMIAGDGSYMWLIDRNSGFDVKEEGNYFKDLNGNLYGGWGATEIGIIVIGQGIKGNVLKYKEISIDCFNRGEEYPEDYVLQEDVRRILGEKENIIY
jgi:hypothetical protein